MLCLLLVEIKNIQKLTIQIVGINSRKHSHIRKERENMKNRLFKYCSEGIIGSLIVIPLISIIFFAVFNSCAYRPGPDSKNDIQRIPKQIDIKFESGAYEIKGAEYKTHEKVLKGKVIRMKGFESTISSGDPELPFQIYDVAVPPNIDWKTLKLTVEDVKTIVLPGKHIILPKPPLKAYVGGELLVDWGEGKEIVDGRNMKIYNKKAFYPADPIKILSQSQMRKWRFVRIGFTPMQYNPVDQKLQLIQSARIRINFGHVGARALRDDPTLRDTLMDNEAKKRFINFEKARGWYRYVPCPQSEKTGSEKKRADPDYVIITTNAIRRNSQKLNRLVSHKIELGHSVRVVTEDDYGSLTGPVPNGTAEKIRQWLKDNYIALGIQYVLLIGNPDPDDPTDPNDSVGDIPMKMCWPSQHYHTYFESPTDYFYANLNGNWDIDQDGFYGEYYISDHPDSPDPTIDPDTFSVRWTGRIQADIDGSFNFRTASDGGIRVQIDGNVIIDHWQEHFLTTDSGSLSLTAGQHQIEIEYYHNSGDARVGLYWLPPGQDGFGVIYGSRLYHQEGGNYVSGGLTGEYFNNSNFTSLAITRIDYNINSFWGTGDRDTNGVDFTTDVYVGRISMYDSNPDTLGYEPEDYATLDNILRKIIDYETGTQPSWRMKFMTASVVLWDGLSDWRLGEVLKSDFADPLGFSTYRIYDSDFEPSLSPECPAINPKDADSNAPCNLLQEWSNTGGYGIITWSTHGGQTGASHLIESADNRNLNRSSPALTFQGSCLNGYPENKDNLGYALLRQGAITTVSASRVSWNSIFHYPASSSGTNANLTYFYTKRVMAGSYSGQALYDTKSEVHPDGSWMNKMDYNLYGDPTVSLFKEGVDPPLWEVPEDVMLTTEKHNGNFGDYQAMNAWVQANGCAGYHVCDYSEVSRWLQTHGDAVFTENSWINSPGVYYGAGTGNVGDCRGWSSPRTDDVGTIVARSANKAFPARHYCESAFRVACCR